MQIICHGLKDEDFPVEFIDHKIFLGRDESNSIAFEAEGVSRFHAILTEEGEELFLQDNDSLNGTFLNHIPVRSRQKLAQGDIIQIGYRLIRVDFQPDQKVVLDFVPPEQTEIVSRDADIPPVSPAPERKPPEDDIERTMLLPETIVSSKSSANTRFSTGSEVGKYIIIKRIGKGGMGEVYLAKHKTLGIYRAIKVLLNDSDDEKGARFLERFIREARLASEIRHPNVVGVMDVETDSDCGVPYIVMEFVDGGSLRNSLSASKRLSEEQAVVIVEAVASALQAAEEHKIVHRDIKPDNIMFTQRGEVKLADLGIAKSSSRDNSLTQTNMMVGTPAYLPPEQAQNAKSVDVRADIYSLGATFYEMLTGQTPYPGENTVEILHKLFLTPVPDPRKINPDISAASASIIMKMLAKDPKDRFQNAGELLDMMERTYPQHTSHESAELVKKVIAGECEKNTSFSSGIASSSFSLWWLRIPHKWFVLSSAGLLAACCVVGVLFLFLGNQSTKTGTSWLSAKLIPFFREPPETAVQDVARKKTNYRIEVRTTPGADVVFISPDQQHQWKLNDGNGRVITNVRTPGNYSVIISKSGYQPLTRLVSVDGDVVLDLPLTALAQSDDRPADDPPVNSTPEKGSFGIQIDTIPGAKLHFTSPDGRTQWQGEADQNGSYRTVVEIPGKYSVTVSRDHYQTVNEHVFAVSGPGDGTITYVNLPLKRGPLVVTTDRDVIDSKDNENSLREAFSYLRANDGSENTILFAGNCRIRLSSSLNVAKDTIIDGEDQNVTLISPETEPMFLSYEPVGLSLKNLSVESGGSGCVFDNPLLLLNCVSVKDDGNARWLLCHDMEADAGSRLHNIRFSGRGYVNIQNGAVLENVDSNDASGTRANWRDGRRFLVHGILKNASIHQGRVFVYSDGACEDLTVRNGLIEHYDGGTINNLTIGPGTLYGYEPNVVLTGTVTVGGIVLAPVGRSDVRPVIGKENDLVFDLTERTGKTSFNVDGSSVGGTKYDYSVSGCDYLIQNMKAFGGARSYTVLVKPFQPSGTYKLAGNASGFNSKMSLEIGDEVHYNVLPVGKPFSAENREYALALTKDKILTLTIRNIASSGTGQASRGNNSMVVIEGIFDDRIEFQIQKDKICCTGWTADSPSDVMVNGRLWNDLNKPFELGFAPDCSRAVIAVKDGRDEITLTNQTEGGAVIAKLVINDYEGDASHYRVAIDFQDRTHEMLQGVLYLLVSEIRGRNGPLFSSNKKTTWLEVLQKFVLGSWGQTTNSKGELYYPDLEQSFKRQTPPPFSCFCHQGGWENGADLFGCRDTIGDAGWVAVYSGYVVAPFSGKFRFLGCGDDMMVVRFNKQIVLDYGTRSLTTGLPMSPDSGIVLHPIKPGDADASITPSSDLKSLLSGNPTTREERDRINKSPLYSKNRLKLGPGDLAASPVLNVQKGQVIPIDILVGELHDGAFSMTLLIERLDSSGRSLDDSSKSLFLFRTSSNIPDPPRDGNIPDFNPDGPVWKVVDSRGRPIPPKKTQK